MAISIFTEIDDCPITPQMLNKVCTCPENMATAMMISVNVHFALQIAQDLLQRLLVIEPDFSIGAMLESGYPGMKTSGGLHYMEGLVKGGVSEN